MQALERCPRVRMSAVAFGRSNPPPPSPFPSPSLSPPTPTLPLPRPLPLPPPRSPLSPSPPPTPSLPPSPSSCLHPSLQAAMEALERFPRVQMSANECRSVRLRPREDESTRGDISNACHLSTACFLLGQNRFNRPPPNRFRQAAMQALERFLRVRLSAVAFVDDESMRGNIPNASNATAHLERPVRRLACTSSRKASI